MADKLYTTLIPWEQGEDPGSGRRWAYPVGSREEAEAQLQRVEQERSRPKVTLVPNETGD